MPQKIHPQILLKSLKNGTPGLVLFDEDGKFLHKVP